MTLCRPNRVLFALALLFGGLVAAWGPLAVPAEAHEAAAPWSASHSTASVTQRVAPAVGSPAAGIPVADHACPGSQPSHGSRGWHRASCRRLTRWLGDGFVADLGLGSIPPAPVFVTTGNAKPATIVSRPGAGVAPRASGPRAPPAQD